MPEGDTIWRAAARLSPVLTGAELVAFEAPRLVGPRPRAGSHIEGVEAVGKHLLVHFADHLSLDTHMRMTGSWHLYRTGERWRKRPHLLRCRIEVPGWEAVCFSAPVVRTYRRDVPSEDPTAHLGPDLCRPESGSAEVVDAVLARMAATADPAASVGDVLLDQRIAAGIGNVYKSEVCFACRVDPAAPIGAVPDDVRRCLIETAGRLLRANLGTSRRTTVAGPPGSVAVYGRVRRPCLRCGTPIRRDTQGENARSSYWCPRCQPSP